MKKAIKFNDIVPAVAVIGTDFCFQCFDKYLPKQNSLELQPESAVITVHWE